MIDIMRNDYFNEYEPYKGDRIISDDVDCDWFDLKQLKVQEISSILMGRTFILWRYLSRYEPLIIIYHLTLIFSSDSFFWSKTLNKIIRHWLIYHLILTHSTDSIFWSKTLNKINKYWLSLMTFASTSYSLQAGL